MLSRFKNPNVIFLLLAIAGVFLSSCVATIYWSDFRYEENIASGNEFTDANMIRGVFDRYDIGMRFKSKAGNRKHFQNSINSFTLNLSLAHLEHEPKEWYDRPDLPSLKNPYPRASWIEVDMAFVRSDLNRKRTIVLDSARIEAPYGSYRYGLAVVFKPIKIDKNTQKITIELPVSYHEQGKGKIRDTLIVRELYRYLGSRKFKYSPLTPPHSY